MDASRRRGLMNDFKAHGLRSMGLLELATDEHGRKRKKEKSPTQRSGWA